MSVKKIVGLRQSKEDIGQHTVREEEIGLLYARRGRR